jgi:RNA polymerase sigma-70 factor (ECF subfamily)
MQSPATHLLNEAAARFIRDRHLLGAFVGGLIRDAHAAEDILQEIWVRLAAELQRGTWIENQTAWCRGVARNLVRQHWEKSRRFNTPAQIASLDAFLDRVSQCFEATDSKTLYSASRLAALDQCVASLPERSRQLLTLKYTQNSDLQAIAIQTGQSFEAVKKSLFRIRAALHDCVRQKLAREEELA